MKIVYIILAHKYPTQLVRLVNRLYDEKYSFMIHIDLKANHNIYDFTFHALKHFENVFFLKRHKVFWGDFSQVMITLEALEKIFEKEIDFDYIKLLSGQDYPIKSNKDIENLLNNHSNQSFLEHFPLPNLWWLENGEPNGGLDRVNYLHVRIGNHLVRTPIRRSIPERLNIFAGSAYWILSKHCASYIYDYIHLNPKIVDFFRSTGNPDEFFFQTLIMNSPLKNSIINTDLTYTNWPAYAAHPKILGQEDLEKLAESSCLFARKFDCKHDEKILDLLD